jgi:FXSXX-COOH protein
MDDIGGIHIADDSGEHELADVRGIPLDALILSDNPALSRVIERVRHNLEQFRESYSAFQSTL